jgi:ComF family protein
MLCLEAAQGMDLCANCLLDLPWLGRICRHCGLPLNMGDGAVCGGCARIAEAAQPAGFIAALIYEFPVDHMVQSLKYGKRRAWGRVLAELLAIRVAEELQSQSYSLPDVLLPVPLHPWREWRRGFNQADEICCWLGRTFSLPVRAGMLRRVRHTQNQASLPKAQRLANLHNAFDLPAGQRGNHRSELQGLRVAIVDDVVTTGATTRELLKLLLAAGAEPQIWAVARNI